MTRDHLSESGFGKRRARRWKKRRILLVVAIGLLTAIVIGVPWALQNREMVVRLINRNAGLAPMRIDLTSIDAGWLRPIKVRGLRLIDDRGSELIHVGEIETELNLVSLLANYRNLGTLTVHDARVALDVQPGTTNLEEAIKPLLQGASPESTPTAAPVAGALWRGRIRIADAVVHARDSVDMTAWDIGISEADIPLPGPEQTIPPMTLVGQIVQTAALPGEPLVGGQFTIRTQPITQNANAIGMQGLPALRMNVVTQGLPLQWMSLVKRRLPDLPIERLQGEATVQAEVEFPSNNAVMAVIHTAQLDRVHLVAPSLVGPRGAHMQQIKLSGDLNLSQNRLSTRGTKLDCDAGSVVAKADLAWPILAPSASQPWLEDTELDLQGTLDLPRLTRVAPDLVRTQDGVELLSGVAALSATQRRTPRSEATAKALPPSVHYQLQLGELSARVQGKEIRWDQALHASVSVLGSDGGLPGFKIDCQSEFCKIDGSGTPHDGRITAQIDLDKMEQRLAEWFVLPLESLSGSAQAALAWKLGEGNRLAANGSLRTTPLRIAHRNGSLEESAWDGEVAAVASLDGMTVLQIDRAHASLQSTDESLMVQVLEPVPWAAVPAGPNAARPATLQIKLSGDMERWQRRAQLFAGIDPGFRLAGKCALEANGGIDASHVEITQADWTMEPFRVSSQGTTLQESRLVGKFQGLVDSQAIARTQVDHLLIQSESFALQAQDSAVEGQSMARSGQAAYRIAPDRLMASLQVETPPGSSSSDPLSVTGDVTGQLHWNLDPQNVTWRMATDIKNLRALQRSSVRSTNQLVSTGAGNAGETLLWEEPQAKLNLDGTYAISTGQLAFPQLQVQTQWLAYGGQAECTSDSRGFSIVSRGKVTYDAASVADRLRPFTGGVIAVEGQRTQPLDISWSSATSRSWADTLQARTSVGWDRADVVGIQIGQAEIPLVIENGHFVSKTSLPISQGTLRWSLDGDLTSDPMVIRQSPERVIENVAITQQMCQGWLKFVAPLLADATSIQGNLSLDLQQAEFTPTDWTKQTIAGQLVVHGANVGPGPLADQFLGIVQQIRNLRKGAGASDGGGQPSSWLQIPEQQIGFAVQQGRVQHRNMQVQSGDVTLVTSGSVGLDGSLELLAAVPIQKEWLDKAPTLQPLAGQQIQIPIRGTVQKPQLDMSGLMGIGQQLATAALQGAAQKQLDKGLNKLLGPLSNQLGPLQQGMQQMQQGVQQSLPQLPIPNLPLPSFGAGPFGAPANPTTPPPATPPAGGGTP